MRTDFLDVASLYSDHKESLQLQWLVGREGGQGKIGVNTIASAD
jgi:hypothetical protein